MAKIKQLVPDFIFIAYTIVLGVILFLIYLAWISKGEVRGVESNVLYGIELILENNNSLYPNPEDLPYGVNQYSPLYYVINDFLLTSLGAHDWSYQKVWTFLRIISTFFLLATIVILYRHLEKRNGMSRSASALFASTFIVLTFPWYSISRPDVLVVFFLAATIYTCYNYFLFPDRKKAVLIGLLLALSIAAKINSNIFIIGLYFLIRKDWKGVIYLSIGFLLTFLATLMLLYFAGYDLTFAKKNIIDGVNNGYNIQFAIGRVYHYFFLYFSVLILGVSYLIGKKWKEIKVSPQQQFFSFLIFCAIVNLIYSFVTAVKIGSGINYFNEFLLYLLFIIAYLCQYIYKKSQKTILALLLIYTTGIALFHYRYYYHILKDQRSIPAAQLNEVKNIVTFLNNNLASEYYISKSRRVSLSLPEKVIFFPTDVHRLNYPRKVYDYSSLTSNLNAGKIKYLVTTDSLGDFYGANLKEYFLRDTTFGSFIIYRNKKTVQN